MSLFTTVTRRPVAVFILFSVLVVFSLYLGTQIPLSLQPEIGSFSISVRTFYSGANAELIEDTITEPLERVLNSLDNVERIASTTTEGESRIFVDFKYKSDMDKNMDNARVALDTIGDSLPDGAGKPKMFRWSGGGEAVLWLNVSGNRNHNELREYIDDVIAPYFDQINGVSYYDISGGVKKSVNIDISLNRLNAYNLTLGEVKQTIQANGFGQTLGSIETKYKNVGVVLDGEYKNIEAIRNIIVQERKISNVQSAYIRLRDIADVSFTYGRESRQVFLNGKPMVRITMFKQTDANTVEVSKNIRSKLRFLESISPPDIEYSVEFDTSKLVGSMFNAVTSAAMSGGIIALVVLIIFLRNTASVFIVACSIPISIILTLFFLFIRGYTLNFMTLAGLAMGIGIIVDNSIVILENIYVKRKNGVKLLAAAEYGTAEMAVPVLVSTATTVLVFLPLIIFERQLGWVAAYFVLLGTTVIVAVLVSYFTSILLVPVLASKFIPLHVHGEERGITRFADRLFRSMERGYRTILRYTSKRRKRFILLVFLVAIAPLMLFRNLPFDFIPALAQDGIDIAIKFPVGTVNSEMKGIAEQFLEDIGEYLPPIENTVVEVFGAGTEGAANNERYTVLSQILFKTPVVPKELDSIVNDIINKSKNYVYDVTVKGMYSSSGIGGGGGQQILKVSSNDRNKLKQVSESFANTIRQMDNMKNVTTNLPSSDIAMSIAVQRERANAYGLSIKDVSDELALAVLANDAGKYIQGSREYHIVMKLRDEDRKRTDLFDQLYIRTPSARRIPLSNFTFNTVGSTDQVITREDGINSVNVSFGLGSDYPIDDAIADIKATLAEHPASLDEDIQYFFTGDFQERNEAASVMRMVILFAVLFVFGIMAGMFEAFADPFIILFAIPLSLSGVVLAYYLTGTSLSLFTFAGILILVGISVNHGIVLIDYTNLLRKRGLSLTDAIVEAGGSRLQPILMTTLTTMGGMAPLALSTEQGTEFMQPLALTLFGGLGSSALLSLFLIPLMYGVFHSTKEKLGRRHREKLARKKSDHEQAILNGPTEEGETV